MEIDRRGNEKKPAGSGDLSGRAIDRKNSRRRCLCEQGKGNRLVRRLADRSRGERSTTDDVSNNGENLSVAWRNLRYPQKHSPSHLFFPVGQPGVSLRQQRSRLSVSS